MSYSFKSIKLVDTTDKLKHPKYEGKRILGLGNAHGGSFGSTYTWFMDVNSDHPVFHGTWFIWHLSQELNRELKR